MQVHYSQSSPVKWPPLPAAHPHYVFTSSHGELTSKKIMGMCSWKGWPFHWETAILANFSFKGLFLKSPEIWGATISLVSSQHQGSRPSNFVILLTFVISKTCWKFSFSKQGDWSLITGFLGPKGSQDFRETDPCCPGHKCNLPFHDRKVGLVPCHWLN